MEKYLATNEGIKALQYKLYAMPDNCLMNEAITLKEDVLGWLSSNFEISVAHFEALRNMGAAPMLILGCALAQAVIIRRPFYIDGFYDCTNPVGSGNAVIALRSSIGYEVSQDRGVLKALGDVRISFIFPG